MARREYKYLIDEPTAERVRRAIAGICTPDAHASGGRYLIDTLYLDTVGLHIYRATVEDERVRAKLRIRTYPNTPRSPVFFEVKKRVDDVIVKTRAAIPTNRWAEILEAGDLDLIPADQREQAEPFFAMYHANRHGPMLPQVLVRYEREPYTSTIDDDVRLTIDRKIEVRSCAELALSDSMYGWSPVDHPLAMRTPGSYAVLELKFPIRAPHWMIELVRGLDLPRLAFSKYARGIETLHIAPLARAPMFY